ncbi:MAG: hypothetical protein HKUEN07_29170 [Rhodocyclaceae bacterium]|uniref:Uncharacterized protein n=1 Tax=Candidatus Desulfobacillus denitrificans TaxID=2608985 RepID=A0A809QWQ4_9PROT|nr:hypothetical protein DSYM_05520 [Candidatus Desulfobacillus denitrificans]GIK46774.1 MAG: hypothetical protein BroJett012_26770 [Betaproteobacteria bacterium]GJQ56348.1 MAG: hypothetical protein HKUEN07_29170 [Rhodocyclaceae bacterium]
MTEKTVYEYRHDNLIGEMQKFIRKNKHPEHGSIKAFADHIGKSQRMVAHWLSKRKPIGSNAAREIESALSLPSGRFDRGIGFEELAKGLKGEEVEFLQHLLRIYRGSTPRIRVALLETVRQVANIIPRKKIVVRQRALSK